MRNIENLTIITTATTLTLIIAAYLTLTRMTMLEEQLRKTPPRPTGTATTPLISISQVKCLVSEDKGLTKDYHISALNIQEAKKNLDKPLLRRKSDLPTDILTQNSLESYKVG